MINRRKNQSDFNNELDERQALLNDNVNDHFIYPQQPQQLGCNNNLYHVNCPNSPPFPVTNNQVVNIPNTSNNIPIATKIGRDKSPEPYPEQRLKVRKHNNHDQSYELSNFHHQSSHSKIDLPSTTTQQAFTNFVYYTVQPGDTLHNLSVKYSCPVAAIKRLNNLWSDQEFFGLTKIKLPAGRLRLIADVLEEKDKKVPSTNTTIPNDRQESYLFPSTSQQTNNQFDSNSNAHRSTFVERQQFNEDHGVIAGDILGTDSIFKNFDLNLEKARTAAKSYDATALMQSLVDGGNIVESDDDDFRDPNKVAQREAEILLNDMSEYGLSYSGLILFIFIVCLICPLAYVIYLEETHVDSASNKAG